MRWDLLTYETIAKVILLYLPGRDFSLMARKRHSLIGQCFGLSECLTDIFTFYLPFANISTTYTVTAECYFSLSHDHEKCSSFIKCRKDNVISTAHIGYRATRPQNPPPNPSPSLRSKYLRRRASEKAASVTR